MKLIVIHNHFRPGGVRRVIELATPHLTRSLRPQVDEVVLASGEMPDDQWQQRFEASVAPIPVVWRTERALGYLAEQRWRPKRLVQRVQGFLRHLLEDAEGSECLVWAHNQGLGRNLLLTRELQRACSTGKARLVLHHHDWWFDNRWGRWPEMQRAGIGTVAEVAAVVFGAAPGVRHIAINHADAMILEKHFGQQSGWLPNLVEARSVVTEGSRRRTLAWLHRGLYDRGPVWLLPCRLLRRKNILEALLLTRWLRPEAWLITTGAPSSAGEWAYSARLSTNAARHGWRLRLGILQGSEDRKPSMEELYSASETVLLTSLQEGFGLAYVEAAAAERPLIARALPNIMPDLAQFGFDFPQRYEELLVDPSLFDWPAELRRQSKWYLKWRNQLPGPCRRLAGKPRLLLAHARPRPMPFSQLTLTAQLEVLRAPLGKSWDLCAPLNPCLSLWRDLAQQKALRPTQWPKQAEQWLSGSAYARRFCEIVEAAPPRCPEPGAGLAAQEEFFARTLATQNLYPLTWSSES